MAENTDSTENKLEITPLNEQFSDVLFRWLMKGGVASGGVGALWSLALDSDIPKALVFLGVGALFAYTVKFLKPIHTQIEEISEDAGEAFTKTGKKFTAQAIAKVQGIDEKYLLAQKLDCRWIRTDGANQYEGMDSIRVPLLEDVFVPLSLGSSSMLPGFNSAEKTYKSFSKYDSVANRDIWYFLAQVDQDPSLKQMAILAWGGYGKTTLLRHIAYIYATKQQDRFGLPQKTPVLLVLRKYRDLLSSANPPDLPDLIVQHHIPKLPGAKELTVSRDWVKDILKNAVVLLDGFDEVKPEQRPAVARWINTQIRQYDKSIYILTSRPTAYKQQDPANTLELPTSFWVNDFDAEQRQTFVEQWCQYQECRAHGGDDDVDVQERALAAATDLLTQIESRRELKDLAKNPLLLNMIAMFHRRLPGTKLPQRKVELYNAICQLQLEDRPAARELGTFLNHCKTQKILQSLALYMMQQGLKQLKRSNLLTVVTELLTAENEVILAEKFIEQVVQISELLVERETDEFEFSHLSFQEYLAATHIAQQHQESLLYEHLAEDWWKPTVLLYAAQTNATDLIQEAMHQGLTDLAYACLQETTKPVDSTLETEIHFTRNLATARKAIRTARYQKLKESLQNEQWQAADQETYRLMISTVGKEEGQLFAPEDLQDFPGDELRAIDTLWRTHSNGRFGFSVQKRIWEECNCPEDNIEDWKLFAQKVGWYTDKKFQGYSNLMLAMNSDAPLGYLPARPFFAYFEATGGGATLWNLLDYRSGFFYIFYYLFSAQIE
jgi:GUN4-like/NACHT domain